MQIKKNPIILAIESSCDDTSAAVMRGGELLSNLTARQVEHEDYGGVVPELASRQHQVHILPVVQAALRKAGIRIEAVDAVAFTRGPGLLGSLIVGTSFAKGLALSLDVPLIDVHHMQAHVLAHYIEPPRPPFPFLCLTVSGGHTQIVLVRDYLDMEILGTTRDDAAGEAFDKTGKMLGLPYPSGPVIDKLAREGEPVFAFPKPRIEGLDFSFSGLKTAIRYFLRDQEDAAPGFVQRELQNICASVQHAVVDILIDKLETAVEQTGIREVAIAGGVSANSGLRDALDATAERLGWQTYIPRLAYCTDNAGMIAMAAHYKYLAGEFANLDVAPAVRMPF
ncbi:MAG: tRNA (adenosine(37)-N6)-threonylcarbamoyltransferase complex transferase subunit TsaD [Saprospiraceae bacterium]|nr:tRNA (adenosine(37)-N6)-threonylcarbamoyltransferase complex transferase subunit TsaD [Saprospiraceae bacterium]